MLLLLLCFFRFSTNRQGRRGCQRRRLGNGHAPPRPPLPGSERPLPARRARPRPRPPSARRGARALPGAGPALPRSDHSERIPHVSYSRVHTPSGKKKCKALHQEDIQRPRSGELPSETQFTSHWRCWMQPARAQQLITGLLEEHNAVIKAEF